MTLSQVPLLAPPEFLHLLKKRKQKKQSILGHIIIRLLASPISGTQTSLRRSDSNKPGLCKRRHHGSEGGPPCHGVTCICVKQRVGAGVCRLGRQVLLMKTQRHGWSCQSWDLAQGRRLLNQSEWPDTSWQLWGLVRHLQATASWQVRRSEENGAFLGLFPRTTSLDIWGEKGRKRQAPACSSLPVKSLRWGWQEREFVLKCHFPAPRPELSMFRAPWMRPADALCQM